MRREFDLSGQRGFLFLCQSFSLRVRFRAQEAGFHCSESKAVPCTAATTGTRKIFSVLMTLLNSVFAM